MTEEQTTEERREAGARYVRAMFGEDFLKRNLAGPARGEGPVADMSRLALEQCYGDIWTRPGLSPRDRSLLTLGILIGAGHPEEMANHVLGALGNGVTEQELAEAAVHAVPYVGFPAAGQAIKVILAATG